MASSPNGPSSADEALALIASGDRIAVSSYGAEPRTLVDALLRRSGELRDVQVFQAVRAGRGLLADPALGNWLTLVTGSPNRQVTAAIEAGQADYLPGSAYRTCRWVVEGLTRVDAALINVAPPDDDGYCGFGVSADFTAVAAFRAPTVIAQVNEQMPRTRGGPRMHLSRFSRWVEVSEPLGEAAAEPPDETALQIGTLVASLVPDGATIEMGIGSVAAGILAALTDHRDLGVHSGLIADPLMALVERGVVNGSRKSIDLGLVVANQFTGTRQLYEWAAAEPSVELRDSLYTHDPLVMAQLDGFVAINSAVQVDLRGQVNSELLNGRQVGGTGGSVDFAIGASLARDGRCIVALPATAGGGRYSRIVPSLAKDPSVTIPAGQVDFVVTEYGVAELRGKTLRERARALIAIAAPAFQESLERTIGP